MKKAWLLVIMVPLFLSSCTSKVDERTWTKQQFIDIVEQHYINDKTGTIRTYGTTDNEEYLLESMGLYYAWLVKVGEQQKAQKIEQAIFSQFAHQKQQQLFLSWRIENTEKATSTSWIDDRRIIEQLPTTSTEKQRLLATIEQTQMAGNLVMDFYDWQQKKASKRVVLSYGGDMPALKQVYSKAVKQGAPFFPEYYMVKTKKFTTLNKVNMVDQLLIAMNSEQAGESTHQFWQWLEQEWQTQDKLSGNYNRQSKKGDGVQSAAVYALASQYATMKKNDALANALKQRGQALLATNDYKKIHFFDLIWYAPETKK